MIKLIVIISFFSIGFEGLTQSKNAILPAHAHNDYLHEKPLLSALDSKFRSIEVDVFSVGDSLFVAHDFDKIEKGRTLRKMYLSPLKEIIARNEGSVYGNNEELILLVDIKNDGLKSYKLLHQILLDYKEILTSYNLGEKHKGAVQVVVSGNRPLGYMQKQELKFAAYDGRIAELDLDIPASLMPLVSDNWNRHFTWRGIGEMPEEEKKKLNEIVSSAHDKGYLLRFWSTPERPENERNAVWEVLKTSGVDLIGTDNLKGLQEFLSN